MQQNNQQWADICPEDTDSDGRTNGAEMGDPDCTWAPCSATNSNCVKLTAVSHPGRSVDRVRHRSAINSIQCTTREVI